MFLKITMALAVIAAMCTTSHAQSVTISDIVHNNYYGYGNAIFFSGKATFTTGGFSAEYETFATAQDTAGSDVEIEIHVKNTNVNFSQTWDINFTDNTFYPHVEQYGFYCWATRRTVSSLPNIPIPGGTYYKDVNCVH